MALKNLPFFSKRLTVLGPELECCRHDDTVVYYLNFHPVCGHNVRDVVTFHMVTARFCVQGHARQEDIARVFRVPLYGVELAVELYMAAGEDGFYPSEPLEDIVGVHAKAPKGKRKSKAAGAS